MIGRSSTGGFELSDRAIAYRMLRDSGAYGGWDVDAFFRDIPESKWEELKTARYIIAHREAWPESKNWNKKSGTPWIPPRLDLKAKNVRRRLNGSPY